MSDRDTALFANTAFYTAFATKDMAAMERLWARDEDVTCIHPGWPPLTGRDVIVGSWRRIFTGGHSPEISCRRAEAALHGHVAIVTCIEIISGGGAAQQALAATNIFVKSPDSREWHMVHHQAGPANIDPSNVGDDETPAMN
jgi:ketosteroid isomerase-like protein